jgi:hypothetical protein
MFNHIEEGAERSWSKESNDWRVIIFIRHIFLKFIILNRGFFSSYTILIIINYYYLQMMIDSAHLSFYFKYIKNENIGKREWTLMHPHWFLYRLSRLTCTIYIWRLLFHHFMKGKSICDIPCCICGKSNSIVSNNDASVK